MEDSRKSAEDAAKHKKPNGPVPSSCGVYTGSVDEGSDVASRSLNVKFQVQAGC